MPCRKARDQEESDDLARAESAGEVLGVTGEAGGVRHTGARNNLLIDGSGNHALKKKGAEAVASGIDPRRS